MFNFARNNWLIMQGLSLVGLSIAICKWAAAWKPTPQFDEKGGYRGKYWELFRKKREKTFNPDQIRRF